jgi:hypothetical protein
MEQIKDQIKLVKQIDSIVKELDPSVRPEAFKFLLAAALGQQPTKSSVSVLPAVTDFTGGTGRELAPQELLLRCGVSSLTDKALTLAFWLEVFQGKQNFTSADIKDAFSRGREPAPSNPSDVLGRLEAAGKVMKAETSGKIQSYKLTGTGISEVEKWIAAENIAPSKDKQ